MPDQHARERFERNVSRLSRVAYGAITGIVGARENKCPSPAEDCAIENCLGRLQKTGYWFGLHLPRSASRSSHYISFRAARISYCNGGALQALRSPAPQHLLKKLQEITSKNSLGSYSAAAARQVAKRSEVDANEARKQSSATANGSAVSDQANAIVEPSCGTGPNRSPDIAASPTPAGSTTAARDPFFLSRSGLLSLMRR